MIYKNNQSLPIKGVNYFGFEELHCNVIHGLWANELNFYLNFVQENNFNSLRIPISYELGMNKDLLPNYDCIDLEKNPKMKNKTSREILHLLFEEANKRDIYILLDMHTKDNIITSKAELSYIKSWLNILPEFMKYNNLLGIDLKNEPHFNENWNDYMLFISTALYQIDNINFKGLYFIEGIQTATSCWGCSFEDLNKNNFLINNPKVVFSPHAYGYDVRGDIVINDNENKFENWFGFLTEISDNAVLIGEFGGLITSLDKEWHKKFSDYLKKKKLTSFYFWSLNCNSRDTEGLLKSDWKTPENYKLEYLDDLFSANKQQKNKLRKKN
jgi:endoglucanase